MADTSTKIVITAEDKTQAALNSVRTSLNGMSTLAASFGASFAGLASAGGIAAFAKSAIDSMAALDDMAEKTGATVESLSALSDIARIGGHDLGTVESGMIRLTKALAGGDDEAKAAGHALESLGLKAADLRKMDTGSAMLEVANALDQFGESGGKSALVMDLLGKNGAALLPFLKDLAEKGELNAKVTTEQAAQAERLQKAWNQLKVASDDLGRSVATGVMPALERLAQAFSSGIVEGFVSRWGAAFKGMAAGLNEMLAASEEFLGKITFGAVAENHYKQAIAYRDRAKAIYAELSALAPVGAAPTAPKGSLADYTSVSGGSKGSKTKVQEIIGAVDDYAARINQAVAGAISSSAVVRSRELAAQIEALDKLFFDAGLDAEIYASALDKLTGATAKTAAENDSLADSLIAMTSAGKLNALIEQQDKAAELLSADRISFEGYEEIMNQLAGISEAGRDTFDELTRAIEGWSQRAADAFADFAASGMRSFSDLGSFADSIMRQMISMTTNELFFKPMFDDIKKMLPSGDAGGGNAWSWLKSLWPFEAGGIMSAAGPLPLQRYATGGIASSPQLALFGEGSMNEAFVPLPDGRSIPVQMRGGAQTIVVNVTSTTGDRAEIRRSAASGARAALGIMSGARRYG